MDGNGKKGNTCRCTPKIESCHLTEGCETPPYLQAVILGSKQHEMVKLSHEFLFYQNVVIHFQLFCRSQSAQWKCQTLALEKWFEFVCGKKFVLYRLKLTLLQNTIVLATCLSPTSCRRAFFLFVNAVSGVFSALSSPLQSTRIWKLNLIKLELETKEKNKYF